MTSRADMAAGLTLDASSPTKSFVLEVHTDEPADYLAGLVGKSHVEATDDAYLFRAHLGEHLFWVDQLDDRFWTFHTDMSASTAAGYLRELVQQRRDLDWMWLPSEHLRSAWPDSVTRLIRTSFRGEGFLGPDTSALDLRVQLAGQNAEQLLEVIASDQRYRSAVSFDGVQATLTDPEVGQVTEAVTRMGRFSAVGDSLELHLAFVRGVVARYRRFVEMCEQKAVRWSRLPDGGQLVRGGPIVIKFSREIPDLDRFLGELLAVREPFRLWGVPEIVAGTAEVEAVDLHVGQRVRFDIGRDWMRLYLAEGSCGNSVARLVSNLQHHFDASLTMLDPDLQAAASAQAKAVNSLSN